jgi:hypothetical protein
MRMAAALSLHLVSSDKYAIGDSPSQKFETAIMASLFAME